MLMNRKLMASISEAERTIRRSPIYTQSAFSLRLSTHNTPDFYGNIKLTLGDADRYHDD